jgi:signal transduction histidine kinase
MLLAELDRAKTAFLSNVSHAFHTPLTRMLGPPEEELRERPEGRERLEVVHRSGLRLLKLVHSLLDFDRIEAGRSTNRLTSPPTPPRWPAFLRSAVKKAGRGPAVAPG